MPCRRYLYAEESPPVTSQQRTGMQTEVKARYARCKGNHGMFEVSRMMSLPPGRRTRYASFNALPRLQIFKAKDIEYASTLLSATVGILSASSCLSCTSSP